jgi:hypothetical protein
LLTEIGERALEKHAIFWVEENSYLSNLKTKLTATKAKPREQVHSQLTLEYADDSEEIKEALSNRTFGYEEAIQKVSSEYKLTT